MIVANLFLAALSALSQVAAHEESDNPFADHPHEVARRQLETNKRHVMARSCGAQLSAFHKRRKAKRALDRRAALGLPLDPRDIDGNKDASATTSAIAPHYSTIQNFTCVTAPEGNLLPLFRLVVKANTAKAYYFQTTNDSPYYLRDDYVRQDLREGQNGTVIYLDIGIIDISTCKPVDDAFVEIWSCNAQGNYAGFGNGTLGGEGPPPEPETSGSAPTLTTTATRSRPPRPSGTSSFPPFPSGSGFPGGPGGPGSSPKQNGDNFLRGGYTTNENGVVELVTIYPGFYTGRTIHIHTMIHQNITYHTNGTIQSASGALRHIGQIFFDEALNTEILAQPEYAANGRQHTYNTDDGILQQANEGGFSAFADIERLGDSLSDGLLGYITIGIDTSADYNITTTNYLDPNFGSEIAE